MKISDILGSNIDTVANQKKVQKKTDAKSEGQNNATTAKITKDSVDISQDAKMLANLSSLEEYHQKRLEEVQKAYENGAYKPNISGLAQSILGEIKNG